MMKLHQLFYKYFSVFVALASAFFIYWLLGIYGSSELQRQKASKEEQLHRRLDQNRSFIENKLVGQRFVARSLAEYVEYNPQINQVVIQNWGRQVYLASNSDALVFTITQEDSIRIFYPKEQTEQTLVIPLIPAPKQLLQSGEKLQKEYTSFDATLLNGKAAVVHQIMIYTPDSLSKIETFWGNAVIVSDLEAIVKDVPFYKDPFGFGITLYQEEVPTFSLGDLSKGDTSLMVHEQIEIDRHRLVLSQYSHELSSQLKQAQTNFKWLFASIALLIAFLNGYLIRNTFRMLKANKILEVKNRFIKAQLSEKVLLIKEIHHRIKNHFQLISSLNRTTTVKFQSQEVREVVEEINKRIELMSKAYDQINKGHEVNNYMPDYIRSVVHSLTVGLSPTVEVTDRIEAVYLDIKRTVYIGILLNELITNSLKHGFLENQLSRALKISFEVKEQQYELVYLENGVGLPPDLFTLKRESVGVQILALFTKQLKGEIQQLEEGVFSGYRIRFPLK